jgi:DnaA-like protein
MACTLLINEPPLQVLPTLAIKIGLNEAIILQQVHYWLNPRFNKNFFKGRYWVRNTYDQWQQQFPFWGEKTIRRAIGNLENAAILVSFITREFKKVKYYTIDYARVETLQKQNLLNLSENLDSNPSGQNDPIDGAEQADRSGHFDPIDPVNTTISYKEENTPENTLPLKSPKDDEDEIKKMIQVWNTQIQGKLNPGKDVHLTSKRAHKLRHALKEVFNQEVNNWMNYCTQIANSRFLMGHNASGFKATLDWALNLENTYKVLEGAIYDKPNPKAALPKIQTWDAYFQDLKTTLLPSNPHGEAWFNISQALAQSLGQPFFNSWFKELTIKEFLQESLTLEAPTSFIKDYILTHYRLDLERAVNAVFPHIQTITIEFSPKTGRKT